jgi:asparagine synthase (glutamine-hydrolysing)
MAGLCGVIGEGTQHLHRVASDLEWTGEETTTTTTYEGGDVAISGAFTEEAEADQPVAVGDDIHLWVWGSVFGVEREDGYHPRDRTAEATAAYCAGLYRDLGPEFVAGLNGDFLSVLHDRDGGTLSVFTDRLGLRDTYYCRPDGGTIVFSTAAQSLSRHPAVTPTFDPEFAAEFLTCGCRTFGTRTPLADTHRFHPGTITTVDTGTLGMEVEPYWVPRYRPEDRPFSYFVEAFTERFRAAVSERLHPGREYGLLLSGGADSRLVLAAMDERERDRLTAYTLGGWRNREVRTAERVAGTAGVDFALLERDRDYHERALHRNPRLSNFVGRFDQAHAEGMMDRIRPAVDEMVTASFADSNFNGYSFPRHSVRIGPVGTVFLPWFEPMDSIEAYIDYWIDDPPEYLADSVDIEATLHEEIHPDDGGIRHHGVRYGSPEELFVCGALTPRTNGSVLFLLQSLRQHCPAWSPFVDNRLVDLYLSMPMKYFARRNVIQRATERLDPELASIRYANTGVPISWPFATHFLGDLAVRFHDAYLPVNEPPEPHLSHGSWPDIPELVRKTSFVRESIQRHEETIRRLPFLDWEGVLACYRDHMNGAERHKELYALLTLLELPVTRRIMERPT